MKTRLSEYDVNKLRSAAKEINDILYDVPEGNFDLSKDNSDYDNNEHPVFGKEVPWENVNLDDGTQIPMSFTPANPVIYGNVKDYTFDDINMDVLVPSYFGDMDKVQLQGNYVDYHPDCIQTVIDVLKNEIEFFASRIEKHETGHYYTAINNLVWRMQELKRKADDMKPIYKPLADRKKDDMIAEEDFKYSGC
jgi:hypothetical protein